MMIRMKSLKAPLSLLVALCAATGCATPAKPAPPPEPSAEETVAEPAPPPFTLGDRLRSSLPGEKKKVDDRYPPGPYEFDAVGLPIVEALQLFARRHSLNLVMMPEVLSDARTVSVSFSGLPFEQAMIPLLEVYGFHWAYEDSLWKVYKYETRIFSVDYLRLEREGSGSTSASVSTDLSGGGGGSGSGSAITIGQKDTIEFWKDLEKQLDDMTSREGKLIVNRTAGVVQVTDLHTHVERIAEFIKRLTGSSHRQVEIEAKIFEVTLNDKSSLGIDWSQVNFDAGLGLGSSAVTFSDQQLPLGAANVSAPTLSLTYSRGDFSAVLSALREQGEIRIVSQPKIITLNNQPALIKVGTDQPYFVRQTTIDSATGTRDDTYSTNYITIGVVLAVTPQISGDGKIVLDVMPVVTRLVRMDTVKDANQITLASAPVVDVKQSSTIVRLNDEEMAVIAGLIKEETSESERSVPLLGDIPGLGALFRGTYTTSDKSELVVFLTPRIVKD
jgi:MSHA type pilus biogenesis protein MshL